MFDASAASKGPSLNNCLYKGPQLTPLLFEILIRFRSKNVSLVGNIEKAFLQIAFSENDSNYLRFLWFDDVFKEFPSIKKYRFARVVFGVTSSPFLLNGTIQKHVTNYKYDPEFITTVLRSFFVDDFTGVSNNTQNTFELFQKLKIRFFEPKFNVTKWRTNNTELRKLISDCESTEQLSGEGKISGISWNNQRDKFLFDIKKIADMSDDLCVTKRSVLKRLAAFYDPLGLIQPLIMNMKLFFQGLCILKLEWDEELTEGLKTEWKAQIQSSISQNNIEVGWKFYEDRVGDEIVKGELHAFSDASVEA